MDPTAATRILIVAHKSVATPALVHELQARTGAGACELDLLIPDAEDPATAAWTLRRARRMLSKEVGASVQGILAEGDDPYSGIAMALGRRPYDEVLISTLPESGSRWLHEDLPARVERLGVPVTVVSAAPIAS